MAQSYDNWGGSGDRRDSITITASSGLLTGGTTPSWVDGESTSNIGPYFQSVANIANHTITIKFTYPRRVSQLIFSGSANTAQGTWRIEGSDSGTTWTAIGSSAVLTLNVAFNVATSTSNRFLYYRLVGVSGSASSSPWVRELTFQIDDDYAAFRAPATSGQLRTSVAAMGVGDYIACKYVANAGAVGTFSNLGGTIPTGQGMWAVSDKPDGYFYFIKVDDYTLIADRAIQHSISYNSIMVRLNSGVTIPGATGGTVKLMTGEGSSDDLTNNDWDRFIVSSNLGGKISAGSNSVWNWSGMYHLTGTVISTVAITRGNTTVSRRATTPLATAIASQGWRPIVNFLRPTEINSSINSPVTLESPVLGIEITGDRVIKYKVDVNGAQIHPATGYVENIQPPFSYSLLVPNEALAVGDNIVLIDVRDSLGVSFVKTLFVTKLATSKFLLRDGQRILALDLGEFVDVGSYPAPLELFLDKGTDNIEDLYKITDTIGRRAVYYGDIGIGKATKVTIDKSGIGLIKISVE